MKTGFVNYRTALAGLLVLHTAMLGWSATRHSPTVDEVAHLGAGVSHWTLERFDLYRVNPPLVRLIAALPVVLSHPKTDWSDYTEAPGFRAEFDVGRRFIRANGDNSQWFVTLARWACIPFSLLAAVVCFRWSADLFGEECGLFAAALWCGSPFVVGFAELITPDAAAAALGLTASYLFWRWLKRPVWTTAASVGVALGLTLLTKSIWVILVPCWPSIWLIGRLCDKTRRSGAWRIEIVQLAASMLLALYVLNCCYLFEGTGEPLGNLMFVSRTLNGSKPGDPNGQNKIGNRFQGTIWARVPIPVPRNYLLGIDTQKVDFERGIRSYLRGEWRHGGWWYYYLYALTVKLPIGTWILIVLACWLAVRDARYRAKTEDELFLMWTPLAVMVFVSSQTGFNHHLRYVLPAMPFLFIGISRVALAAKWRQTKILTVVVGAFLWSVGALVYIYPHSMSYFNEMAGGPRNGARHLLDSNIDWGQDLPQLRRWLEQHLEARPLHLAYFGLVDPRTFGIEFQEPARGPIAPADYIGSRALRMGPQPGWYAVSVNFRYGLQFQIPDGKGGHGWLGDDAFTYFLRFQPVAMAGYSICIFHLERTEVNAVRLEMGLPELPDPAAGS